jgi:hypothetical protein
MSEYRKCKESGGHAKKEVVKQTPKPPRITDVTKVRLVLDRLPVAACHRVGFLSRSGLLIDGLDSEGTENSPEDCENTERGVIDGRNAVEKGELSCGEAQRKVWAERAAKLEGRQKEPERLEARLKIRELGDGQGRAQKRIAASPRG